MQPVPQNVNDTMSNSVAVGAGFADRSSRTVDACPLCASPRLTYVFTTRGCRVVRCDDCRFILLSPLPERDPAASEPHDNQVEDAVDSTTDTAGAVALRYWNSIERYRGAHGGTVLIVGCGDVDLLAAGQSLGYQVTGVDTSRAAIERARRRLGTGVELYHGELGVEGRSAASFDVCVLSQTIERVADPRGLLAAARGRLKPGGALAIVTPTLDARSARPLNEKWSEFRPDHLCYFDSGTVQNALFHAGFREVVVLPSWKWVGRDRSPANAASRMLVLARPAPPAARRRLSVVIPAYNEARTFAAVLDGLANKQLRDLDMELVIVESNSSDGTREIALQHKDDPRVRLVLQDRPRGKGNAVRAGFEHATGDFVLIQDADLEYDLEDYGVLLEPLVQCREAFVLGSRHAGNSWKIRHFANQRFLSAFFNSGHWFFTFLVDLMYGLGLKDPFTMYKVFRRDCLYGLRFEFDRFDFDYELLIKLVRKGYVPIEIPVNYRSRSFQEGKKISILRDPATWLWALVRLKFVTIDPLREIERRRARANGDA